MHEKTNLNKNGGEDEHQDRNKGDEKGMRVGMMIRRKRGRDVGVDDKH